MWHDPLHCHDTISLPAGAPLFGPTFVCDQGQCYRLYTTTKNFDGARKQCALDGGDLVTYGSLGQQLLVENYFKKFTLPAGYWVGTSRASVGAQWQGVDGSPLPQLPSGDPYAHWGFDSARMALAGSADPEDASGQMNCVFGDPALAYDRCAPG